MSQQSIASYFNARKRPATEDLNYIRPKVFLIEGKDVQGVKTKNDQLYQTIFKEKISTIEQNHVEIGSNCEKKIKNTGNTDKTISTTATSKLAQISSSISTSTLKTRSGRILKNSKSKSNNNETPQLKQQNLVNFIKKGHLSPCKKLPLKEDASITVFASKDNTANVEKGLKTQNQIEKSTNMRKEHLDKLVKKELNFEEVKSKITRSAKLEELKASINRLKELEKIRKLQEENSKRLKNGENKTVEKQANLKKFETIELEVLTSPQKGFKTPTKPVSTKTNSADKNALMSPRKVATPKQILFSPTEGKSPLKTHQVPAYQRFHNLIESEKPTLQLPYKYRYLIEIFRCIDSVCAMFYNRKETITFKKLKPAVQRMSCKNFTESHLAQIKHIYSGAFQFTLMKTRNFGSTSKQDYFQLVITPIVESKLCDLTQKIDEDNVLKSAQSNAMSPQIMTKRLQKFTKTLLDVVKNEHDKFLKSLDPPFNIPKDKITRWHPEFDLENCPNIEEALLPQPPNIEKFSSAKDILSTARNLFDCATPMERAMINYEAKMAEEKQRNSSSPATNIIAEKTLITTNPTSESILKGVPKSLLEKIRAKQAAKMLNSMTRRESEDREIINYSRLPELARHLRNVFITEKKGVLPLEIVIKKIRNSYEIISQGDIETHLRLISKELPEWIVFHEIRKTIYLKLNRDMDLMKIIETLTNIANKKSK